MGAGESCGARGFALSAYRRWIAYPLVNTLLVYKTPEHVTAAVRGLYWSTNGDRSAHPELYVSESSM